MGLTDWFMKRSEVTSKEITFGRYTDLYKPFEKYQEWDLALEKFNNSKYLESYHHLFEYIRNEKADNIQYEIDTQNNLSFEIFQGSKLIKGFTDPQYIVAEVKLAHCTGSNLSEFRTFLEESYKLKYTKYCLDQDKNLCLVFESNHLDANPYKLYYGLKELATLADLKDNALIKAHPEFEPINTAHITTIDSYLLKAKFEYFKTEISQLLNQIDSYKLTLRENLGSFSYLICAFAYKMDYLLVPESSLMVSLNKLITLASNDQSFPLNKNISEIIQLLKGLDELEIEDFNNEFYNSIYTFGVTTPVDHKHIVHIIESNMEQLRWYVSKEDSLLSSAVSSFVVGKLLYENAVPSFEKELMHLYYRVTESIYFTSCGISGLVKNGELHKKGIQAELKKIEEKAKDIYLNFEMDYNILMWDLDTFGPSFVLMVLNITYSEKK